MYLVKLHFQNRVLFLDHNWKKMRLSPWMFTSDFHKNMTACCHYVHALLTHFTNFTNTRICREHRKTFEFNRGSFLILYLFISFSFQTNFLKYSGVFNINEVENPVEISEKQRTYENIF